jgi:hypothetical protein
VVQFFMSSLLRVMSLQTVPTCRISRSCRCPIQMLRTSWRICKVQRPRPSGKVGCHFTYHIGLGPATVRMRVRMNQVERPIWNVIAKIRGTQDPEEIVLVGNHRDAWAYGGVDPNSGTTSILEMAAQPRRAATRRLASAPSGYVVGTAKKWANSGQSHGRRNIVKT